MGSAIWRQRSSEVIRVELLGAILGAVIDRQFDGTITPLAIWFVICNTVAFLGWKWAIRSLA